jgi:tetratricopeptide (TPR) repeat protein
LIWDLSFGKRKKQEETPKPIIVDERKTLEKVCEDLGRKDLYEPLSNILSCDPRKLEPIYEKLKEKIKKGELISSLDSLHFANSLFYKEEYDQAKEYFEKAYLGIENKRKYISLVLNNFEDVKKIAKEWWERNGIYKKPENP